MTELKMLQVIFVSDLKMATKVYIMGCTVDGLAFQTAQEGLQHYNGKKHRLKMTRFLKTISNEKVAIHIKGMCSRVCTLTVGVV